MPRRTHETIKFLTFDELKRLFNTIKAEGNKRDRALFLLAYRHGLRASEVGRLHKTDVDFKQLRIYCHRLKGSYGGQHTMEPDEVRILKAYLYTHMVSASRAERTRKLFSRLPHF